MEVSAVLGGQAEVSPLRCDPLTVRYYLFPEVKSWLRQRKVMVNLGGHKRLCHPHWGCACSNRNGQFSRINLLVPEAQ